MVNFFPKGTGKGDVAQVIELIDLSDLLFRKSAFVDEGSYDIAGAEFFFAPGIDAQCLHRGARKRLLRCIAKRLEGEIDPDRPQQRFIVAQGDRKAAFPSAARTADTMHIALFLGRYVVVDDGIQSVDVDAPSGNVGRYERGDATVAKLDDRFVAVELLHIPVKGERMDASLVQRIAQFIGLDFRIAKNHDAREIMGRHDRSDRRGPVAGTAVGDLVDPGRDDVACVVEASDDLGDWTRADVLFDSRTDFPASLADGWLADLEQVVSETTVFASNTSALSISEMAAATKRPGKVIGMHFFNPAHIMKLVEIIPGLETSQETIDDTVAFTESLRKLAVVVQECPGFLVNRLLMPYLNEATWCLQEGAATATEIDAAMTEFGMPMGPFTLMDMLGIDVCQYVGDYLYGEYGPRMEPAKLFYKLVDAGRLGEKNGKGFYGYGDETDEPVKEIIASFGKAPGSVFSGNSPLPGTTTALPSNEAFHGARA